MLKGTKKSVNEISVRDLDDAITEFLKSKNYSEKNFDEYGYEAIAENEWSNYQQHSFTVAPISTDIKSFNYIGGRLPSTDEMLDWMCAEGQIEAGEYLVDCSW